MAHISSLALLYGRASRPLDENLLERSRRRRQQRRAHSTAGRTPDRRK
jgi:hypothetical protein